MKTNQLNKLQKILKQIQIKQIEFNNTVKLPIVKETRSIINFEASVKRLVDESIPPAYIQSELCNLITKQLCNSRCVKYSTEKIDYTPERPYFIEKAKVELLEFKF